SAAWRSPATSFVLYRPTGTTDRLSGQARTGRPHVYDARFCAAVKGQADVKRASCGSADLSVHDLARAWRTPAIGRSPPFVPAALAGVVLQAKPSSREPALALAHRHDLRAGGVEALSHTPISGCSYETKSTRNNRSNRQNLIGCEFSSRR